MRIQRQQETFAWRVAAELPWSQEDQLPVPRGFQGTGQDWSERSQALEKLLGNFQNAGIDSRSWHGTKDPITGEVVYNPDRVAQQEQVMAHFRPEMEATPRERSAILFAGLGGAGKSTLAKQPWSRIAPGSHFSLSADNNKDVMSDLGMIPSIKWLAQNHPDLVPRKQNGELYDFSPMELSSLIQRESNDIANRQAQEAYKMGTNVAWDYRMGNVESAYEKLRDLRRNSYNDNGVILVDVSPKTSRGRGITRHTEGQEALYGKKSPRGGRRLPLFATRENFPTPGSGLLSSSAESFRTLITEHPELVPKGWLHVNNEDFAHPKIENASGLWQGLSIPAPQQGNLVAAGRRFVAARNSFEVDPESVLGLLDAYRDGTLDFQSLVPAIVQRYQQIQGVDRHPERAGWSHYMESEFGPDEDNGWWIGAAVWAETLTEEEAQIIRDEVHQQLGL